MTSRESHTTIDCRGAGELSSRFSHSWPTTSRHLGILLDAGVVSVVTNGRQRHYRVRQMLGDVLALWLNR